VSSKVYIVFTDDQKHWWSGFLKKGIRHCYVVIPSDNKLITYAKTHKGFDLFTTDAEKGIIGTSYILYSYKPKKCRRGLFMLNTCVGHTKQILGINNPFILTPYQLYKYVRKNNG
jgi:hypothetical protein